MHPSVIDQTLVTAWNQCGLPTPDPPCSFLVDLHKPQVECNTNQECIEKGLGNFCSQENNCETHFDDDYPPPNPVPTTDCDKIQQKVNLSLGRKTAAQDRLAIEEADRKANNLLLDHAWTQLQLCESIPDLGSMADCKGKWINRWNRRTADLHRNNLNIQRHQKTIAREDSRIMDQKVDLAICRVQGAATGGGMQH